MTKLIKNILKMDFQLFSSRVISVHSPHNFQTFFARHIHSDLIDMSPALDPYYLSRAFDTMGLKALLVKIGCLVFSPFGTPAFKLWYSSFQKNDYVRVLSRVDAVILIKRNLFFHSHHSNLHASIMNFFREKNVYVVDEGPLTLLVRPVLLVFPLLKRKQSCIIKFDGGTMMRKGQKIGIMGNLVIDRIGKPRILYSIFPIQKPLDAEARSLYLGLLMLMKVGGRNVIAAGDCLDLIDAIRGKRHPFDSPFFSFILDLNELLYKCKFIHVHREGNEIADCIIRRIKEGRDLTIIVEEACESWEKEVEEKFIRFRAEQNWTILNLEGGLLL